jgi:gamma-glutamyltranspeptidase/glutathione hydrolase
MNAGMENFARAEPIHHNGRLFGVSNMAPSVARMSDGARLAIGCPGARRIPANVALVLARHGLLGVALQPAVSAGRVHAEDLREVFYEKERFRPQFDKVLGQCFAKVTEERWRRYYGPLTAILVRSDGSADVGLDDRGTPGYASQA